MNDSKKNTDDEVVANILNRAKKISRIMLICSQLLAASHLVTFLDSNFLKHERKFPMTDLKFPFFDAKKPVIFEIISFAYLAKAVISVNINALSQGMLVFAVSIFQNLFFLL